MSLNLFKVYIMANLNNFIIKPLMCQIKTFLQHIKNISFSLRESTYLRSKQLVPSLRSN